MKVRVHYTKVIEEVIEIDDCFNQLTEEGGVADLTTEAEDALASRFLDTIDKSINPDYCRITYVEVCDSGEVIYED